MEWIVQFYERQEELGSVYSGPAQPHHHENAGNVTARLGGTPRRLLELGAGGGQNAFALASLGHDVTAVEIVPRAARHARTLTANLPNVRVVEGDFYDVSLEGPFDAVLYFDGFGVGSDEDQRRLLRRAATWLTPDAVMLVDIYTPWYWAGTSGIRQEWPTMAREYGFDADECRMLDTWWSPDAPERRVTQSLRCYSPQDLRLLLAGTGLELTAVVPGGAYDHHAREYRSRVPLHEAMTYLAELRHAPDPT